MKYDRIDFRNVGPIEEGTIHRDRLSVLIGPNNSGKTVAARIIHGVCQADEIPAVPRIPAGAKRPPAPGAEAAGAPAPAASATALIRHAGLPPGDVPTHGRRESALTVRGADGSVRVFDFAPMRGSSPARGMPAAGGDGRGDGRRSAYIQATATDGARRILEIMRAHAGTARIRDGPASQPPGAAAADKKAGGPVGPPGQSEMPAEQAPGEAGRRTGAAAGGLDRREREMFSRFFPGSIELAERSGVPPVTYVDPSGHRAGIESVGSGVASLLPIVAGVHRIGAGGTCVIEEPESHLEPQKQLVLMDEVMRVADGNKFSVVITTQSDFLVQKVLSMVSSGRLDTSGLGLYYLRRPSESLTRIEKLRVERTGEAEQEMFTKALDALVAGS